ncbi:SDR family oxidoreductase [Bradyrhizobium tropiciagri]|uniref:SDR family oxidoreductase n=1 Tax=Bradyrhizobium tropiciagri TaxID=312253 RepID=UPI001BA51919|nr:SDR family oxidoreductase [Bradyrhizobium tropiciagri]MBR0873230.1 SDR family oxidoreductase [Bradyrhizobium tropiciagri]
MIVITGATGELGQHVVERLVFKVPPKEVCLAVRSVHRAERLSGYGVRIVSADYDVPESLSAAFSGAEQVLLISSSDIGRRVSQHKNVIDAARAVGVKHFVYTSMLHADTCTMAFADEHRQTEQAIRASGLPFTILRNGWYAENCRIKLRVAMLRGVLLGSAGYGAQSMATRGDYAEAAVAALTGRTPPGRVYELAGDVAWTYADMARELSRLVDRKIDYRNVGSAEHRNILTEAGLPTAFADFLVDVDRAIAAGELMDDSGDLQKLISRPATPLPRYLEAMLAT